MIGVMKMTALAKTIETLLENKNIHHFEMYFRQ